MPGLVTMADVHEHLNLDPSDTSHDNELQGFINAMGPVITYMTGPIVPTVFIGESHNGGGPHIMLFNPPILSVQSVTEYAGNITYSLSQQQPGATVDNYGFSIDSFSSGMLTRRGSAGVPLPFFGYDGGVIVNYTAGLATIPPDVRMAALEDLRGLYQQSQQGGRPAFGGGAEDDSWSSGPLDLFPRLAMLLEGRFRTQSIA
jgi:hypothetical protein